MTEKIRELDAQIQKIMYTIPNIPNPTVPDGDTDADNVEVPNLWNRQNSILNRKRIGFGSDLGILDPETAAKITGTRFTVYSGAGAQLERAIVNFYLDTHTRKNGYKEIFPPFMVHRNSMIGTGQLPKFEEDAFKVANTDYFLVPTAEVPVTNMHRDEILDGTQLPLNIAHTPLASVQRQVRRVAIQVIPPASI